MSENINSEHLKPPDHWTLQGFYIIAFCFNLCLVAQVLSVGMAYFYAPEWWMVHVSLVRAYSGLSLILCLWAFSIAFPKRIRALAISLPILLGLQFLTIHLKTNIPLAVLHPLIGFTLFNISATLVHRTRRIAYPKLGAEN